MWKMILSDGTELTGFRRNGSNYISETEVDVSVLDGRLSILTLTDGEETLVMHNAVLIQQVRYSDGWYLCFRELSRQELFETETRGKLDYLAMMTDIELEV